MSNRSASVLAWVLVAALGGLGTLHAQTDSDSNWTLPPGKAVRDNGTRSYRFTVDYHSANARGEVFQRQRLIGEYTRGLPGGQVMWKNVTHAVVTGKDVPMGLGEKVEFMEGFRYRNDLAATVSPEFFKGFPPAAVMERNLVWDAGMIEMFGQDHFDRLKLNQPMHLNANGEVALPGVGKFFNRDIVLQWVGRSLRNGQACAVIQYQAFFNPLEIAVGGMTMNGRSDYWGEIWVSLTTRQIEYATLYENVVAEMHLPGQSGPQLVNVFRMGVFEPVVHE